MGEVKDGLKKARGLYDKNKNKPVDDFEYQKNYIKMSDMGIPKPFKGLAAKAETVVGDDFEKNKVEKIENKARKILPKSVQDRMAFNDRNPQYAMTKMSKDQLKNAQAEERESTQETYDYLKEGGEMRQVRGMGGVREAREMDESIRRGKGVGMVVGGGQKMGGINGISQPQNNGNEARGIVNRSSNQNQPLPGNLGMRGSARSRMASDKKQKAGRYGGRGDKSYLRRRAARIRAKRASRSVGKGKTKKKMNGIGFWMIVGVALFKDLLDILLHILFFLSWFILFINMFIGFIILFYLWAARVKLDARKAASIAISGFFEMLPALSMLPTATINLFVIRYLENKKIARINKKKERFITTKTSYAGSF